jgi:hypothetical protein
MPYKWRMPLAPNARDKLRVNLQQIAIGHKPKLVKIGALTEVQLTTLNAHRLSLGLQPNNAEVVFVGRHTYKSRISEDGYSIDDVIDQIASAMDSSSVVITSEVMTAMENQTPRKDRYGNLVLDRVIFECSGKHPYPELLSVIPKGDEIKPQKEKEAIPVDSLSPKPSGSPG